MYPIIWRWTAIGYDPQRDCDNKCRPSMKIGYDLALVKEQDTRKYIKPLWFGPTFLFITSKIQMLYPRCTAVFIFTKDNNKWNELCNV